MKAGVYDTKDAAACARADATINLFEDWSNASSNSARPMNAVGKPVVFGVMGKDKIPDDDVQKLVEYRKKGSEKLAEFLGDGKFFGGDKPSIGDFWVAGGYFACERNTIKNGHEHVYAACNAVMPAPLAAWMDRMTEELKDYIATRPATSV